MIEPYYSRDGITIYNADCRDVLPTLGTFDLLLTDPPYGCKRPSQRTGIVDDVHGNDSVDTEWLDGVSLSESGAAYLWTSWEVLEQWRCAMNRLWRVRSCIVWDKCIHGLADLETCWAPRHEMCLFAANGRHVLASPRPVDVIAIPRGRETSHPYEKPVPLFSRLLAASAPQTIIDPFMGSGTTLVAAKQLGLRATGIEISREYCELAVERLRQGVFQF